MTKIEAIVQPHRWEDVKNSLIELAIAGMTVWEVRGPRPPKRPHGDLPRARIHG